MGGEMRNAKFRVVIPAKKDGDEMLGEPHQGHFTCEDETHTRENN